MTRDEWLNAGPDSVSTGGRAQAKVTYRVEGADWATLRATIIRDLLA